jgi:16S rRNA (guanine527-N7)-methyltransferase
MYEKLQNLGFEINKEQEILLSSYIDLFKKYNEKINLISNNDVQVLFEKHIFDSLAFNLFYEKYTKNKNLKLLDIGCGGGFPSLPISLFYKNIDVVALDSINKKINFIKETKEKLELKNIIPICTRVEDLEEKNHFDIVTSRAMAELRMILEYAIPFVKKNGYFVAYKSIKANEELKNAQNALKILNCEVVDLIEYSLPIEIENKRILIIIKKIKETSNIYPRKNGLIKKKPL